MSGQLYMALPKVCTNIRFGPGMQLPQSDPDSYDNNPTCNPKYYKK